MAKFVNLEKISLKGNAQIKEDLIQSYIFDNPSILGLGELSAIRREKIQPAGGRLDLLLGDDDKRYEVEVQLGATDPSHIIRTIEYWDMERKRYPQYDHCAVIVAEEITGRFMNVIQLFNGAIPLIAIQVSAYKVGDEISLTFTKVLDRVTIGTDDEDEYEVTDRNYWESKSTPKTLKFVDDVFLKFSDYTNGYELKYNKFYIGIAKDGIAKNFISFRPRKNYVFLCIKSKSDSDIESKLDSFGLPFTYSRWNQYEIRLNNMDEFNKAKEVLDTLVKNASELF